MKKYQYSPLTGARQIRLLKLYAGAGADALSGELVDTSLDETPSFIALSYAWGEPQPRRAICCSGLEINIGPSLHSALQHIRQPDSATLLWADALCINQEDITERSQQVKIMSDIYAAAFPTAIWLGEASDEIKLAFGWLRRFAEAWDTFERNPPASRHDPDFITENRAERALQAAFGKHRYAAFGHIWALLNRPWFTRKWIIQELVKSQMPVMVAGREVLPWALLAGWTNFVERCPKMKELFIRQGPRPLASGPKVLGVGMLRATLLTRIAVQEKQRLLFLIVKTLEFRCADPRDHVFAMVGIASDSARFDLINYRNSMEQVCRQLAYACVLDSTNLKLLWSLVYLASLTRRVRSWVPNLESVLADMDGSVLATQFSVQQYRDYNASGDTELQARVDDDGNRLMIRGRIIDRIQLLGSNKRSLADARFLDAVMDKNIHSFRENLRRMLRERYHWLEECLAIAKTTNAASEEEAFQNALLANFLVNKEVHPSFLVVKSEFTTQIRLYKAMAYETDYDTWKSAIVASTGLQSSHLLDSILLEKLHRRFGRTENGRLGWLPPVAEEGDFVCVFDGMELPYAIRPAADGRYLLVGECIIPGLMMGEAEELSRICSEIIVLE